MPHIILVGTLDTKLDQYLHVHQQLQELSNIWTASSPLNVTLIDAGRHDTEHSRITIPRQRLISRFSPKDGLTQGISSLQRGELMNYMAQCSTACVKYLIQKEPVHGVLGLGGSGGTSLISSVMKDACPIGMPKLLVSTISTAAGDTDITTMYSVVDIAGTNELLRSVLSNAAGAILGMSIAYERRLNMSSNISQGEKKIRVGITMFGVTTPAVTTITKHLEANYPNVETFIFHATGSGGQSMERMINDGQLDAVLDLTTTEICDHLFGGNMSAGPTRLSAALLAGVPNIISIGATDMVNFGARPTVPEKYRARRLLEHNSMVTLMRTSPSECSQIGEFIAKKIKENVNENGNEIVEVWLPRGGVSMVSTKGEVFEDGEADEMLVESVKQGLKGSGVKIVEDVRAINDEGFAVDLAECLMRLVERGKK